MSRKSGRNRGKKAILNILIIVCILVLAYSAYRLISYYLAGQQAEKEYANLRYSPPSSQAAVPQDDQGDYPLRQQHYRELYEQNGDFIGWVKVYGMNVDYPVMQTPENQDYYLHRNFDKNYSSFGCVFASDGCDVDKPSDVVILYGHKMKNGSMFGKLSDLEKKDYYDEHQYIQFDTLKERHSYLIVCIFKTTVDTGSPNEFKYYDYVDFLDETDFNEFIGTAKEKQVFDTGETIKYGDKLILLSTCEYTRRNGRLIVIGKEIPNSEAPAFP